MRFTEKIKSYLNRSREKHKLTFINDNTYHEKWSFRLSSFNLVTLFGLYTIIILVCTLLLVRYTPLKKLFVETNGLADGAAINRNSESIDSLYEVARANEIYLQNLKLILNDQIGTDSSLNQLDPDLENYTPDFTKNASDSILRDKVENGTNSSIQPQGNETFEFFFAPVKGVVSQSYDEQKEHYGADIVTQLDAPIKSCLEGTVVMTGWVQSEGKVIVVQHKNDLISVYKHCSAILKETGERVQTGDPIGIVGNSGEHTSGPHLHFELWKKGHLLNPEAYISF